MTSDLTASDIHGYGVDPDLKDVSPTARVTVTMIAVDSRGAEFIWSLEQVERFIDLYRQHGPWALPPVVCIGDADTRIAGNHRTVAAREVGLSHIPAFIVHS